MKKDFVKIQATYDFILDQFESGDHLDDVSKTVNDNLEDFLAIGCEPAKLASMMDPVDVLTRAELFKGIDVNPVAKRLDYIDFEVFFKQLVELGVKAPSIRTLVAEWDGETIVSHIADLRKCGFSKKDLAELLYEKIGEYGPSFDNEEYLDVVSTSERLYVFLSRECLEYAGDGKFYAGYYEDSLPFDVATLVNHGADKRVITKWIADQMVQHIFDDDLHEELEKYDVFPSEEQIVSALDRIYSVYPKRNSVFMKIMSGLVADDPIHGWMEEDNQLFIGFMDDSENPHELISKLNDMSDCAITEHCEDNCYDVTESDIMQFPDFWKNIAILFLEDHNEGSHDELYYNLRNLDWLQIDESEWKKVLSDHKEWLEECIKEFENDSSNYSFDYSTEIELLNKLLAFAS